MTRPPSSPAFFADAAPYDAADEEVVKQAEQERQQRIEGRKRVSALLLGTREGREWLWQILRDCGTWEKHILGGDAHANGFFEGKREIGLSLVRHLCQSDPTNFGLMVAENDAANG